MVGSPFRITARKLPPEPRYSRFYRTFRVLFDLVALIVLPTIVVLAFWPSPFKYPWGIPVGADQRQLLLPPGDNYFCRWIGRADGLCDLAELRAPTGAPGAPDGQR